MLKMKLLLLFGMIVGLTSGQDIGWWKNTIVYQVYPRSFQDSDADGTGDIKGIESRLEYLADLGVETIWLSPIYESPMKDFGYDISNFTNVDTTFGSLADFQRMSERAHELGLKIVMDFVPNHSSDEHTWFKKSVAREDPYTDFYVWQDPKGFDEEGNPIPPNNWLSVFRFSAWEYVEERGQFYYHAFLKEQPDLNYRNPLVVNSMKDVIRYWINAQGVDGFRMDAVPFLFEDPEFKDEPESGKPDIPDEDDYGFLDHIYTFNLPQVYDMIHQFNDVVSEFETADGFDRVVMVEALSPDLSIESLMQYYDVCDFAFNFNLIVHLSEPLTAQDIDEQVHDWLDNMPAGKTANWVLGNHDNPRIGSRFRPELIDGFNMISMMMPGVAVTYYGEEIGMLNAEISFEDTIDPQGCNCGPDRYELCSRDPERTPMQWTPELNAGFSDAPTTWLPIHPNYKEINVEVEDAADESHLKVYKHLVQLRQDERVKSGDVKTMSVESVFAFSRFIDGSEKGPVVVAVNVARNEVTVDISQLNPSIDENSVVDVRSVDSENPATVTGSPVDLSKLTLYPNEAVVMVFSP